MKNLFKKLLACCLAVCMVLTLCVGALSVSAEEVADDYVKVDTVEALTTDANAVVPVTILSTAGVAAAEINVNVGDLTISALELVNNDENVEVTYASAENPTGEPIALGAYSEYSSTVAPNVIDGVFTYIVHLPANTTTTVAVTLNITFAGPFAEGANAITVDVEACKDATSDLLTLDEIDGAINATVPHECVAVRYENVDVVDATCTTAGSYVKVGYCECGKEASRETIEIDALDHDYTYTDNGDGTHSATCANGCDGITNEAHTYVEGTCVCGAVEVTGPKVDPNLVFWMTSVGLGDNSVEFTIRVRNTVLALYDDIELVVIPQKYDLDTLNLVENPKEVVVKKENLADAGSAGKAYVHKDIYLYELGLQVEYMLRAYDAEGNLVAVSEKNSTSPADSLKTLFAQQTNNAKLRTLITDTLIVGDESVKSMAKSYEDSDLAKATSIIEGFDTSEATQSVMSYNTIDNTTYHDSNYGATSSFTHRVLKSVTIGKVPFLTYRIRDQKGILDLDKFAFKVSYTKVDGAGNETPYSETFTTANSDISLISGWVNFKFDAIGIQDGDKNITIEVTYDGAPVFDSVYSIESYLGSYMSNDTMGDLATAIIKLGISFRNYSA